MEPCDLKIIQMRKDNARLSTIREYLAGYPNWTMIDEAVQLAHVLDVLDSNGLAVSRKEVRTAFNKIYRQENHLDKKGYLNWYYKAFHIKMGTKVSTCQVRAKNSVQEPLIASQVPDMAIKINGSDVPTGDFE